MNRHGKRHRRRSLALTPLWVLALSLGGCGLQAPTGVHDPGPWLPAAPAPPPAPASAPAPEVSSQSAEASPLGDVFVWRDGRCRDELGRTGRNMNRFESCGFVKGRVTQSLKGGDMRGLSLQFPTMNGLSFRNVDFSDTRIDLGVIQETKFFDIHAARVDWRGAQFIGVRFERVHFVDADLRGTKFKDVVFIDCTMDSVDLTGASLTRVWFEGGRQHAVKTELMTTSLVRGF